MSLEGKKVGVSGSSGFLGRRILGELEERGAYPIEMSSKVYDLRSEEDAKLFFETHKPDMFIHSAALYGGLGINETMPAHIFDYNMRLLLNVYKGLISEDEGVNLEKMLCVGSACGYPSKLGTNMKEELMWDGPVDSSVRNYGTIKKLMETVGHVYRDQYGLNSVNTQLATLYGENDTFNPERSHVPAALIRRFVEAKQEGKNAVELWGVPETIREFMYVGDAAIGIVKALESFEGVKEINDQSKYTLNIGTGQGITIDFLANTIKNLVGYKGEIKYNGKSSGQKEKALVIDRMKEKLNWSPLTGLTEGLDRTIKWYVENKEEADKRF